jgi:hypothetical protein
VKLFGHKPLEDYIGNVTFLAAIFDAEKKKLPCIPVKG